MEDELPDASIDELGKMVLLGLARVFAVEQPTEVESQVAAVVWLAHGGSLIRALGELSITGYLIV